MTCRGPNAVGPVKRDVHPLCREGEPGWGGCHGKMLGGRCSNCGVVAGMMPGRAFEKQVGWMKANVRVVLAGAVGGSDARSC